MFFLKKTRFLLAALLLSLLQNAAAQENYISLKRFFNPKMNGCVRLLIKNSDEQYTQTQGHLIYTSHLPRRAENFHSEDFALTEMVKSNTITEKEAKYYFESTQKIDPFGLLIADFYKSKNEVDDKITATLRAVARQIPTQYRLDGKVTEWRTQQLPFELEFPEISKQIFDEQGPSFAWELGRAATLDIEALPKLLKIIAYSAYRETQLVADTDLTSKEKSKDAYFYAHATNPKNAAIFSKIYGFKKVVDVAEKPGHSILRIPLSELVSNSLASENSEKMNELRSIGRHALSIVDVNAIGMSVAKELQSPIALFENQVLQKIRAVQYLKENGIKIDDPTPHLIPPFQSHIYKFTLDKNEIPIVLIHEFRRKGQTLSAESVKITVTAIYNHYKTLLTREFGETKGNELLEQILFLTSSKPYDSTVLKEAGFTTIENPTPDKPTDDKNIFWTPNARYIYLIKGSDIEREIKNFSPEVLKKAGFIRPGESNFINQLSLFLFPHESKHEEK